MVHSGSSPLSPAFVLLYSIGFPREGETSEAYKRLVKVAEGYDSIDALRQDVSAGNAPFSRGSKLWHEAVEALVKLGVYHRK